jgi:LuxR family maltose regulon positive regulatory protein
MARPSCTRARSDQEELRDRPVILVQAPAGFGKTSLMAQWRREHLAHGRCVAWLSGQAADEPGRFIQSLALSVRLGAGRPTFGHTLLATAPGGLRGDGVACRVAHSAIDIVLMSTRPTTFRPPRARPLPTCCATHLPTCARDRGAHRLWLEIDDLVTYGACIVVGPAQLRAPVRRDDRTRAAASAAASTACAARCTS